MGISVEIGISGLVRFKAEPWSRTVFLRHEGFGFLGSSTQPMVPGNFGLAQRF